MKEEYSNTDYSVTGWMLYVISHNCEDVRVNEIGKHMNHINVVIKTLFHRISDDEINDYIDTVWSEYQASNNKNGIFGGDAFIWIIKDITRVIVIDGIKSILYHVKRCLVF